MIAAVTPKLNIKSLSFCERIIFMIFFIREHRKMKKYLLFTISTFLAALLLAVISHLLYRSSTSKPYSSLEEIEEYARTLPEFPPLDDDDWLNPRYDSFFRSRAPYWKEHFLTFLGYKNQDAWGPQFFARQLKKLTAIAKGNNPQHSTIIHIKSKNKTSIYVFGDVHSAFHSMVRNLSFLRSKNIIQSNLKIADPHTYFIFNGNYFDRSPYNLDSLILLSTLITMNPKQVFYLRGDHEQKGNWNSFALERELVSRARYDSLQTIPFKFEINEYFKTLPEAIYVSGENDTNEAIRIAFNEKNNLSFDENEVDTRQFHHNSPVAYIVPQSEPNTLPVDTRASIQSQNWWKNNCIKNGLGRLEQDYGANTWAVLSSPIYVHQKYLNFYDDAFVKITITDTIKSSYLSLFHQDIRVNNGYTEEPKLNVITGAKIITGTTPKYNTLKLASSMSLDRGSRTIGLMAKKALNLAVNQFNSEIDNKTQIRLYIENDDYIPNLARNNVTKFVNDKIKYLILPVGSPTILSYIDSLDKSDFAILYPLTGSLPIRNKKYTNLALFRASLDDEAKVLIRTVYRDFGAKKFALFYQDDGVGTHGPFEAALKELEAVGITNTAIITYTRGSTNFENQVKELFEAQPDALGFFSNAQSSREFIRQAGILKLANMKLFGVSFIGEAPLKRFIKRLGIDILFGAVVPNPYKSQLPIVKEYRSLMDTINSNYDVYSLEAYISTKILIEAIKNTEIPITPRKIIKHMESFKNYDFHGIKLNFNPETRCISQHMWLESSSDDVWPRFSLITKEQD